MAGSERQPDAITSDGTADDVLLIAGDIYVELTERLLDAGRKVPPNEWEARYLRRVREPILAFPVEDAIIAAAQRVNQRIKGVK